MSAEPIKKRCQNCSALFLVRNIYEGDDGLLCEDCALKAEALRNEGRDSVILIRCTDCLAVSKQNKNASMESECGGCIAKERDQFRAEIGRLREALREERWQLSRVEAENAELHPMFKSLSANIEAACHELGLDLAAIPGEGPMQAQNAVECITKEINQLRADLAESRQKLAEAQADCAVKADAIRKLLPLAESGRVHHGLLKDTQPIIEEATAALASNAGDALVKELESLRRRVKALPADWLEDSSLETWFPYSAEELKRKTAELKDLRAQRDQAVALARELGERLQEECNIDDRTGKPRWSNTREALAKLQSLNPPTSDDTLKV